MEDLLKAIVDGVLTYFDSDFASPNILQEKPTTFPSSFLIEKAIRPRFLSIKELFFKSIIPVKSIS